MSLVEGRSQGHRMFSTNSNAYLLLELGSRAVIIY